MKLEYLRFPNGYYYLASPHTNHQDHNDVNFHPKSFWAVFSVPFALQAYKKVTFKKNLDACTVISLEIPANSLIYGRTKFLVGDPNKSAMGYKFRANRAFVLGNSSPHTEWEALFCSGFKYTKGKMVFPKKPFDMKPLTCSHGIHFFLNSRAARGY